MYRSFGAALDDFASSLDIADERVLAEVRELLKTYLIEELGFNFFEVLTERWYAGENGPERVLDTYTHYGGKSFRAVKVKGGTTNQTTYCFVKDQPLWITAVKEKPLKEATHYIDSWSGTPLKGLPKYKSGNTFPIRTSIIQPLRNEQGTFGVINVESKEHRSSNRWAKGELELVAKGVASIVERVEAHTATRMGTDYSIGQLRHLTKSRRWNLIGRPKLFVACSEEADGEVVKAVLETVDRCKDHEVIFWQEHKGSGDIRQRMLRRLCESRVIVCYLSERVEKGQYVDNPNVLIEAGIAQGLECAWRDVKMVVIREEGSVAEIPFDIGGHDILKVPRNDRGGLSKREFKKELTERVTQASDEQDR